MDAQVVAIPAEAKVIRAWQYDEFGTQQWLEMDIPSYWIPGEVITQTIDGKEVSYQYYTYNVDEIGDAMAAPEYWRFEVEVNN
jgi:hypothetical protein